MRPFRYFVALALGGALLVVGTPALALPCGQVSEALIVFDRSNSMSTTAVEGKSKLSIAREAVGDLLATFGGQLAFGLQIFPGASSCAAGTINVAPAAESAVAINSALSATFPSGQTPLGSTFDAARAFLQSKKRVGVPQVIILITDGMESCGGNPVAAASKLWADGVRTYVVGFGGGVDPETLGRVAKVGGTDAYVQANDLTQLTKALTAIAGQLACCGDGKLDAGEHCDTLIPPGLPGACPTSCVSAEPCATARLLGKGCNTHCALQMTTALQDGDGCCPLRGTAASDSDCPDLCGNGVVDAGERCDTALAAGLPGACPTSCDDGDPCTADQRVGSGCTTGCIHLQLCGCGNGQLDSGERCDTAIAAGQPGACPTVAACDDGDPCTVDRVDGAACQQRCTNNPAELQTSGSDGCCVPGVSSLTDIDCPPPCGPTQTRAGQPGDCVDLCAGVSCPDGQHCSFGRCAPWPGANETSPKALAGCCSVASTAPPPMSWLALLLGVLLWGRRRRA